MFGFSYRKRRSGLISWLIKSASISRRPREDSNLRPSLRRRVLYPAELRRHVYDFSRIFKVFRLSGPGTFPVFLSKISTRFANEIGPGLRSPCELYHSPFLGLRHGFISQFCLRRSQTDRTPCFLSLPP